ncbi:MAG: hypothetical protein DRO06_01230 [Thermoproteota archaeon]|nr:MAG: hypothetical protein DRO06_01230 [Candidatus Korarchaeota archaeon]
MKRYVDLKLRPSSESELPSMIEEARRAGFSAVGVVSPSSDLPEFRGIDLVPVAEVEGLRRPRGRYAYVSAVPRDLSEARSLSKARWVDALVLPAPRKTILLDSPTARFLNMRRSLVEIRLSDLLSVPPAQLSESLRILRLELSVARKYGVPLVLTSGASSPVDVMQPIVLASLASSLLGIPWHSAVASLSDIPAMVLSGELRLSKRGVLREA